MTESGDNRRRKKPSRGVFKIPGQSTIAYVTVCTQNRKPWLATPAHCTVLSEIWRTEALAWRVGLFVLMPDHLHLFAALADDTCELETWVRYWKRLFGQAQPLPAYSFQENCWHMRVRNARHYQERCVYVRENPVRRGLVKKADDWPFTGIVHGIQWWGP